MHANNGHRPQGQKIRHRAPLSKTNNPIIAKEKARAKPSPNPWDVDGRLVGTVHIANARAENILGRDDGGAAAHLKRPIFWSTLHS
jgi:hypothetical protein